MCTYRIANLYKINNLFYNTSIKIQQTVYIHRSSKNLYTLSICKIFLQGRLHLSNWSKLNCARLAISL